MAGLQTGGFGLTALPTAPNVPSNVGRFDPTQVIEAQQKAIDLLQRTKTLKSATDAAQSAYQAQIAQNQRVLATAGSGTQADIAKNQAEARIAPAQATMAETGANIVKETAPTEIQAKTAGNLAGVAKAGAETQGAVTEALKAEQNRNATLNNAYLSLQQEHAALKNQLQYQNIYGSAIGTPKEIGLPASVLGTAQPTQQPVQAPLNTVEQPQARSLQEIQRSLTSTIADPNTGTVYRSIMGPGGITTTPANMDTASITRNDEAMKSLLAAGIDPKPFQNNNGMIGDITSALQVSHQKLSSPTTQGKANNMLGDVRNPVAGESPLVAVTKMNEIKNNDARSVSEATPIIQASDNLIQNADKMKAILAKHRDIVGKLAGSKFVNGALQYGDELKSLIAGKPELSAAIQEYDRLGQSMISDAARIKDVGSNDKGSAMPRILAGEVGWFSSKVPDMQTNYVASKDMLNRLQTAAGHVKDHAHFIVDNYNDYGFIPNETASKWQQYRDDNPAMVNGEPNKSVVPYKQYFSGQKSGAQSPVQSSVQPQQQESPVTVAKDSPTTKQYSRSEAMQLAPGTEFMGLDGKWYIR